MDRINLSPREGEIYKVIRIDGHVFELRFGYYEEFERRIGEPVVVYPDLSETLTYTSDGKMIVTAIQDPCKHFCPAEAHHASECCSDCEHFYSAEGEIGICTFEKNRKKD